MPSINSSGHDDANTRWSAIPVIDLSHSASASAGAEAEAGNSSSPSISATDITEATPTTTTQKTASAIISAASTHGFLYIKPSDEDLPATLLARMFELSRGLFSQSDEYKSGFAIGSAGSGKNMGWTSVGREMLDPKGQTKGDLKEAFNIGEFASTDKNSNIVNCNKFTQPLPEPLAQNESELRDFQSKCHKLCLKILRYIAIGLKIEAEDSADWFSTRHDQAKGSSGSILRFLYYPALPPNRKYNASTDIRAGAHSDYGSLTLLFQLPGQPGLEIQSPSGSWVPVPTDPDTTKSSSSVTTTTALPILANIGDLLSYWTNGLLRSTVHRVVFPKNFNVTVNGPQICESSDGGSNDSSSRYSIAYFCHPLNDAKLEPLPSEAVRNHQQTGDRYVGNSNKGVMTAKDHLDERLAATYS